MKFKHGDKVKCTINNTKVDDAKISINKENGFVYICQNELGWGTAEDKLGYEYSWMIKMDFTDESVTNLRLAEKSFDLWVYGVGILSLCIGIGILYLLR